MMRQREIGFGLAIVLLLVVGCSQPDTMPMAKVTGTVTYNGEPIDNVSVTFIPESGARPAAGLTDASGKFTLSTLDPGDGASPGMNKVALTETPDGSPPMPGEPGFDTWKPPVQRFPIKYANPEESGFTATVIMGQNDFTFDMTGEAPAADATRATLSDQIIKP